jgi:hypothetical protein
MKNLFLLPTDKPSMLWFNDLIDNNELILSLTEVETVNNQNIYITSDEEIKEGDWVLGGLGGIDIKKYGRYFADDWKKIILTTDQDLIADGVQSIEDEFLEWFVKNPSCEEVEVEKKSYIEIKEISYEGDFQNVEYVNYKIIIPQEDINFFQITVNSLEKSMNLNLEYINDEPLEAALSFLPHSEVDNDTDFITGFELGAEWQSERMYSEEDLEKAFKHGILFKEESVSTCEEAIETEFSMLVEQFKKN